MNNLSTLNIIILLLGFFASCTDKEKQLEEDIELLNVQQKQLNDIFYLNNQYLNFNAKESYYEGFTNQPYFKLYNTVVDTIDLGINKLKSFQSIKNLEPYNDSINFYEKQTLLKLKSIFKNYLKIHQIKEKDYGKFYDGDAKFITKTLDSVYNSKTILHSLRLNLTYKLFELENIKLKLVAIINNTTDKEIIRCGYNPLHNMIESRTYLIGEKTCIEINLPNNVNNFKIKNILVDNDSNEIVKESLYSITYTDKNYDKTIDSTHLKVFCSKMEKGEYIINGYSTLTFPKHLKTGALYTVRYRENAEGKKAYYPFHFTVYK
ncbi:MAG: hypothetical protein SFY56_02990 [Bacteroidota bacterium]|nr:hypothetical protein [Bacteroidota bacterium]